MIPKELLEHIKKFCIEKRYGNIQINFSDGKILNWNTVQSFRATMTITNHPDTKIDANSVQQA